MDQLRAVIEFDEQVLAAPSTGSYNLPGYQVR
jgi:hypothetical protein